MPWLASYFATFGQSYGASQELSREWLEFQKGEAEWRRATYRPYVEREDLSQEWLELNRERFEYQRERDRIYDEQEEKRNWVPYASSFEYDEDAVDAFYSDEFGLSRDFYG